MGSTRLKKALFMIPGEACDTVVDDLRLVAAKSIKRVSGYGAVRTKLVDGDIAFNPLLLLCLPHRPRRKPRHKDPGDFTSEQLESDTTDDDEEDNDPTHDKLNKPMLHAELLSSDGSASCRRMFITQPPLQFRTIGLDRTYQSRWNGSWRTTRFRCDQKGEVGKGKQLDELIKGVKYASPAFKKAVMKMVRGSWTFELC